MGSPNRDPFFYHLEDNINRWKFLAGRERPATIITHRITICQELFSKKIKKDFFPEKLDTCPHSCYNKRVERRCNMRNLLVKFFSRIFLLTIGVTDYRVKIDTDGYYTQPNKHMITVVSNFILTSKEKNSRKFFRKLFDYKLVHPLTYSLLHEAGHAVSFTAGRWLTEACMNQYEEETILLQDLVDANMLSDKQAMRLYYTIGAEKDANQIAKRLFDKYRDLVIATDDFFQIIFPIRC